MRHRPAIAALTAVIAMLGLVDLSFYRVSGLPILGAML